MLASAEPTQVEAAPKMTGIQEFVLLGHDEASHDALARGADVAGFSETLLSLFRFQQTGRAYRLLLPVRQRGLGSIHRTFNLAQKVAGARRFDPLPPFEPRPVARLAANLEAYLARMGELARGTPIRIQPDDPALPALAQHLQGHASPENDAELLRLFGLLTEGVYIGPRTFHMDLANSCNENCAYCWFHSPHSKSREDADRFGPEWKRTHIDYDTARKLVDDLARLGTREDILLTGKGEPLTHPRCLDIVDYIKSKGMHTTLFTNGILLEPSNLERLHRAGLDLLYVSLSAASHPVYEALHPGHAGSELEVVRENLLALQRMKQSSGRPCPRVVMVDVVNHDNAHELADFARWSADIGADYVRYQLIHVQYYNESLKLTPQDLVRVRAGLAEAKEVAAAAGMRVMENIDFQLSTLVEDSGAWGRNELPAEGCFAGWYFSRSWADGTVSFCCSPKPIANLDQTSFASLWEGPRYGYYRNAGKHLQANGRVRFTDGTPLVNGHCFSCPNYEGLGDARRGLRNFGLERWLGRTVG
ncbi:MAG: radical SAM protein [Candidatus Wallbacteria bacterium]|nr:radical SAM protein [Candidatus Wallbacteria bacterium]